MNVLKIIKDAEGRFYETYKENSLEIEELNNLIANIKESPGSHKTLDELLTEIL